MTSGSSKKKKRGKNPKIRKEVQTIIFRCGQNNGKQEGKRDGFQIEKVVLKLMANF